MVINFSCHFLCHFPFKSASFLFFVIEISSDTIRFSSEYKILISSKSKDKQLRSTILFSNSCSLASCSSLFFLASRISSAIYSESALHATIKRPTPTTLIRTAKSTKNFGWIPFFNPALTAASAASSATSVPELTVTILFIVRLLNGKIFSTFIFLKSLNDLISSLFNSFDNLLIK